MVFMREWEWESDSNAFIWEWSPAPLPISSQISEVFWPNTPLSFPNTSGSLLTREMLGCQLLKPICATRGYYSSMSRSFVCPSSVWVQYRILTGIDIPQTNFGQCGAVNLFFRSLVLVATNAQTTIMASKNHTMETQQQPWYKQKQKIQKFPAIVFRCLQFSWTSVVHSCTTTGKQCIATNGLWEQANSHPSISSSWLKQVAIIFGPVQ